jgi:hypothetical protein
MIQGQTTAVGLASATSANGVARDGASLPTNNIQPGSLIAQCIGSITTASVVATYAWHVTSDGTNWDPVVLPSNAASTTIAGGGGSPLAHRRALSCPDLSGYGPNASAKVVATLSGATTAGADVTAVTYRYVIHGVNDT